MFSNIHQYMAFVTIAAAAITLIAGLVVVIQGRGARTPAPAATSLFRRLLVVTLAIGVVQAILGGILYVQGCRPGEGLHFVYGLIVLGAIPVAYVYSDQKNVRRDLIIMTIAAAAITGAAIRATMTGSGLCP